MLDEKAIASVGAILLVSGLIGGLSIGTPVAVDSYADQQPDESLYGVELAGERIKEVFADDDEWQFDRADERLNEFENMVEKGKGEQYFGLIKKSEDRLEKGMDSVEDNIGLTRAGVVVQKHIRVLERVKDNLPDNAKQAINTVIERNQEKLRVIGTVENRVEELKENNVPPSREQIREIIEDVRGNGSNGL